ncbi:response regulator [bacterium]|nr:response regulator [bacterium]
MNTTASVLVIDDEPGIRDLLAFELTQENFEVETAESGYAAVEAVKRRKFDLAITDLKMHGMDGVATVEALRKIDPDLEIIVATGFATVETAVACMKRGAYDYIQKPFNLDELKTLLERAMEKSHLQGVVALYEASRAILDTLDTGELVSIVIRLAVSVLKADVAWLVPGDADAVPRTIHFGSEVPEISGAALAALNHLAADSSAPLRVTTTGVADLDFGEIGSGSPTPLSAAINGSDRSLSCAARANRIFSRPNCNAGPFSPIRSRSPSTTRACTRSSPRRSMSWCVRRIGLSARKRPAWRAGWPGMSRTKSTTRCLS